VILIWVGGQGSRTKAARVFALAASCVLPCLATGCGSPKPPPPAPAVVAPPAPPPVPPEVEAIAAIRVKPGGLAKVPVKVRRQGNQGIIELVVQNPPQGITVEGGSIPANASRCELVVKADQSLGDQELAVDVPVTGMVNGMPIEASFKLTVPQYEQPEFTVEDGVILVQGRTKEVTLRCDRKGFPEPIGLAIEEASPAGPEGVACSVESLEANQDSTTLQITVADDVADGVVKIPLAITVRERKTTSELPFTITRYPFRVGAPQTVVLAPGESRRLALPVERNGYDGAVKIEALNAPPGLELPPLVAAERAGSVELELRCAADAADKVSTLTLRASGGDLTLESPLVVRVSAGDDRSVPEAVRGSPRVASLLRKGSYGGRMTPASKQSLRDLLGGTSESDAAVSRGLSWLARAQQPDGGWSLAGDTAGAGGATAGQPGGENRIAATALALLPFLAEGITHKSAPEQPQAWTGYKPVVETGLVFLAANQQQSRDQPAAGSWNAGTQAQALATIAFCEAYAISRAKQARFHAQLGLKYLLDAQDPSSGGWRNAANETPGLSITVWAVMALRAAQFANLTVKAKPLEDAEKFIRLCAAGPDERFESRYASGPGREADPGLTAAALMARLQLGWGRDEPDLLAGRDYLMQSLPPVDKAPLGDLFLFHFATQVLQQLEGPEFDTWNALLREHLIRTQDRDGDLAGSWDPQGMTAAEPGGRIHATALALLTLQTYYRHLPLFRETGELKTGEPGVEPAADSPE
jgi:hypothetical protein